MERTVAADLRRRADFAGCGVSAACLAHCLALPFLASLAPALGPAAEAEWVHWLFVALAAPVAAYALTRPGATWASWTLAIAGVGALVAGAAEFPAHEWETPLSVSGALLLASAHLLNAFAGRTRRPTHG